MTDLEKSIELARKHEELFGVRNREEYCVAACQEMAEWKNDKFYTLLACVKFSLEKSGVNGVDEFINKMKEHWEE